MRNISGWILRTFENREKNTLLTAWKTLVLPIHDYCRQLWSPFSIKQKKLLEDIQHSFIRKIKNSKSKDYKILLAKYRKIASQGPSTREPNIVRLLFTDLFLFTPSSKIAVYLPNCAGGSD